MPIMNFGAPNQMMTYAPMDASLNAPNPNQMAGMESCMPQMSSPANGYFGPTAFNMCMPETCMPGYGCYEPVRGESGANAAVYVVRRGDTVYRIAQENGVSWETLASYNQLERPELIYPGQRLLIPAYA
jgi:hypothetical protein